MAYGRPSPRTVGTTVDPVTGEEIDFQKFGIQQLFFDPSRPSGVKEINTGATFKGLIENIIPSGTFGTPTPRNTAYPDMTITKTVGNNPPAYYPPEETNGKCTLDDHKPLCGLGIGGCCECPNWFTGKVEPCTEKPPENGCDVGCLLTGRGCDCGCKDLKPCTTCDSDVCEECNAWDLQCEDCRKKDGTCTPPPEPKTMLFWAKIIAVVIGIGVFLWLLRPLFSRGSKPTGGFTITPT